MSDKLLDGGFRNLTMGLAALVATVLLAILVTVFSGAREAIAEFGTSFLTSSAWDPVNEKYGAFTAIYGTLVSSFLALLLAVPLGIGTAIFITEDIIPRSLREAIGLMIEMEQAKGQGAEPTALRQNVEWLMSQGIPMEKVARVMWLCMGHVDYLERFVGFFASERVADYDLLKEFFLQTLVRT
jgi:hypothetical protein